MLINQSSLLIVLHLVLLQPLSTKSSQLLLKAVQADNANLSYVKYLLKAGADVNTQAVISGTKYYTPLQYAMYNHHWSIAMLLVKSGANVNPKPPFGDEHYLSPLMHCSVSGPIRLTRVLLRKGANVNEQGYHGLTALMLATRNGRKRHIRLLLKCGADLQKTTYFGHQTALNFAIETKRKDVIDILYEANRHITPK